MLSRFRSIRAQLQRAGRSAISVKNNRYGLPSLYVRHRSASEKTSSGRRKNSSACLPGSIARFSDVVRPVIRHMFNQCRDRTGEIFTEPVEYVGRGVIAAHVCNLAQGRAVDSGGLRNFPQCYPAPLAELLFRHQLLQLVSNHRPDRASTIPAPILALWPCKVTMLVAQSRYL